MVPRRPTPRALSIALACLLATSPPARADEIENYQRLQAMPRERRLALAENLERFDKLDPQEQAAVRKLDAQLARKDPVEQARYRAHLRRYHLWVNGLAADQKQALQAAESPEARFALARKYRIKELQEAAPGPRLAGIRIGDYGLVAPFEMAHLLKVWFKLAPAKKAEIEKQPDRGRFFAAIRKESATAGVKFEPFPAADELTYTARFSGDASLKAMLGPAVRWWPDVTSKKGDSAPKKAENPQRRFEHPFAEFLYFADHKPPAVSARNLERFSAACPPWFHAMTDPLAPDDAREYLTILYRLIYPHPQEMPVDSPAPAKAPGAPPNPASKKATNAGPF